MDERELSPSQKRKSSAIINAARAHFAAHGFEATKLSEVAKDSGVAVGTIYLRYTSKAELLAGVLDDVEQSFVNAMDTPEIWRTPFPQRFAEVVSAVLSTARDQQGLAELMALSAFASTSPSSGKKRMLEKIAAHIDEGMSRGELRGDLDLALAARMAHGMVEGAMRELMSNPDRNPSDTVAHVANAFSLWLANPDA